MLVMHFGHRDPEMHSHDATSYYAAIRPASAASHPYAVRHSSHNDFTPGCVACFARTTPGYRGLLDPAFGSPVSSPVSSAVFLYFLEQFLCPLLKPGQYVILDNASPHNVEGVRELIEKTGNFSKTSGRSY